MSSVLPPFPPVSGPDSVPRDSVNTTAPATAAYCAACGARLTANARFCHRCGTPFGESAPLPFETAAPTSTNSALVPWGVAIIAVLALIANIAGKTFGGGSAAGDSIPVTTADGGGSAVPGSSSGGDPNAGNAGAAPFANGAASPAGARAPNIANLSPSERAARLYNRIMEYSEAGKADSVSFFAPMAMASHEMLTAPSADERYHYGRIAEVTGNPAIAKAQADSILKERPTNLLGLLLAARAARLTGDKNAERSYGMLLVRTADKELATKNTDYEVHRAEIDRAVTEAKSPK